MKVLLMLSLSLIVAGGSKYRSEALNDENLTVQLFRNTIDNEQSTTAMLCDSNECCAARAHYSGGGRRPPRWRAQLLHDVEGGFQHRNRC